MGILAAKGYDVGINTYRCSEKKIQTKNWFRVAPNYESPLGLVHCT